MADHDALYCQDLAQWGQVTAAHLRAGRVHAVNLAAIAEELESLGPDAAHRLWEHLRALLGWFLAWNYAPDQRLQHSHWYVRVVEHRVVIEVIVKGSLSLRPVLNKDLSDCYTYGREIACEETGLPLETFPATCPWTAFQVVHASFWPMGDHELSTRPIWVTPEDAEQGRVCSWS